LTDRRPKGRACPATGCHVARDVAEANVAPHAVRGQHQSATILDN